MEMIIVVAIIAILAVITIPTLTANTDNAKKSADAANLRSAKAAYQVMKMEDPDVFEDGYYDFETSTFKKAADDGSTTPDSPADYCGQCSEHKSGDQGAYIELKDGTVNWSNGKASCDTAADED